MRPFTRPRIPRAALALTALLSFGMSAAHAADDVLKPDTVKPANAVVLFDGTDTSHWDPQWPVKDGAMTSEKKDSTSKEKFTDYKLHLEFNEPLLGPEFTGENRGNSGVYQQGRYEIQVLDSYEGKIYPGACAAVYGVKAPAKNAAKPPGQWQTFDITFHAAKYKEGKKTENAHVTVYWNGELVQDNTEIPKSTGGGAKEEDTPGPIRLQYHHHSVQFRNIWVVPLDEKTAGPEKK
jgi:hypothetical protein